MLGRVTLAITATPGGRFLVGCSWQNNEPKGLNPGLPGSRSWSVNRVKGGLLRWLRIVEATKHL